MQTLALSPPETLRIGANNDYVLSRLVLVLRVLMPARTRNGVIPGRFVFALACCIGLGLSFTSQARAGFVFDFAPRNTFQVINTNADGSVTAQSNLISLTGGNNGSGLAGTTDYVATALASGTLNFNWTYSSLDLPTLDFAGYLLSNNFFPLADTDGQSGTGTFAVNTGDKFGFRVGTADNTGEPGVLTVTPVAGNAVPEPRTTFILLMVISLTIVSRFWFERTVHLAGDHA